MKTPHFQHAFVAYFLSTSLVGLSFVQADSPPLKFSSALSRILSRSTATAIQQSKFQQQKALDIPVRFQFLPTLNLSGSRGSFRDIGNGYSLDSKQVEVDFALNIFRFGADVKGWQAANEDELNQVSLINDQILKTEDLGVQALLLRIQRAKEMEIYQKISEFETELYKIARQRYDHGLLASQEVNKVQLDLENAQARLADSQVLEASAVADLGNLLGSDDVESQWPWADYLRGVDKSDEKKSILLGQENDLSNRPDVKAAELHSEAESDRYSQRVRQILPSLDASFNYSLYTAGTFPQLDSTRDPNWIAQITLSIPLFDQLVRYSTAKVEYFNREQADVQLDQIRRNAMADWSTFKASFQLYLRSAVSREKLVGVSQQLYDDSLRRFKFGRIDANDLAIDQQRLADSELLSADGWANAQTSFSKLCHARGLRIENCLKR